MDTSFDLYNLGREAMERGDLRRAVDLFQESIDQFPHFKTLELQGECLLKLGEHHRAIVPLAAAATPGTREFRALYLLAQALVEIGEEKRATEKLEQAIGLHPDFAGARRLLHELKAASTDQANQNPS